jgi:VIT1/CCC1 family predicted Fe2+/Mn2+ transporter
VVLATLPPTIPFLLVEDAGRALRISNGVAVAILFFAGYWLGRATGVRPWLLGLAMAVVGSAMVGLTIALGG